MRSLQSRSTIFMPKLHCRFQLTPKQLLPELSVQNLFQFWVLLTLHVRMLLMYRHFINLYLMLSGYISLRTILHSQLSNCSSLLLRVSKSMYTMSGSLQNMFIDSCIMLNMSLIDRLLESYHIKMRWIMSGAIFFSGNFRSKAVQKVFASM